MSALSPGIQARIDNERGRLQLLAEVLTAIALAAEDDPELVDARDVMRAVRAVIGRVVKELDSVWLQRP